eukprot:scaffold2232_cov228-Pinguiococcus_pyrenoidosus.AAC.1
MLGRLVAFRLLGGVPRGVAGAEFRSLGGDGEHAVVEADAEVLLTEPRNVGGDQHVRVVLREVHGDALGQGLLDQGGVQGPERCQAAEDVLEEGVPQRPAAACRAAAHDQGRLFEEEWRQSEHVADGLAGRSQQLAKCGHGAAVAVRRSSAARGRGGEFGGGIDFGNDTIVRDVEQKVLESQASKLFFFQWDSGSSRSGCDPSKLTNELDRNLKRKPHHWLQG